MNRRCQSTKESKSTARGSATALVLSPSIQHSRTHRAHTICSTRDRQNMASSNPVRRVTFSPVSLVSVWWTRCLVLRIRHTQKRISVCYRCAHVKEPTAKKIAWTKMCRHSTLHQCPGIIKINKLASATLSKLALHARERTLPNQLGNKVYTLPKSSQWPFTLLC